MGSNLENSIRKLMGCNLPLGTKMIKGIPLSRIDDADMKVAIRLLQSDNHPEYDVLHQIYAEIEKERAELIKDNTAFYYSQVNSTPKEIWEMLLKRIVRIHRLIFVYEPDYNYSVSENKPKGEKYDMVKINWIDENGKKFRKVTKTYGKVGQAGLEHALPKLLETYYENLTELKYQLKTKQGFIIDLVAKIDKEPWAFELKATSKDNFIKTGVRMELWKLYRQTYEIGK